MWTVTSLAAVFVPLLGLVLVVNGQQEPCLVRTDDGSRVVEIDGFQGIVHILLTLRSSGGDEDFHGDIRRPDVDGKWRVKIPEDALMGDEIDYVIQYNLLRGQHTRQGSLSTKCGKEYETGFNLLSRRYLERRLTTVMYDDFTSGGIDASRWKRAVEGDRGGNEEFQMYTPLAENSYVKDNVLYIRPTMTTDHFGDGFLSNGNLDLRQTWGECTVYAGREWGCHLQGYNKIPPIMAAKLSSKASIRYGKVTVTAKMPKGDWIWPAIWMLPTEDHYGGWPRSGEIDIIETRGNLNYRQNGRSLGADVDNVNIHWGPQWDDKTAHGSHYILPGKTFADDYNAFWIDWTENYIRLGVNDHTIQAWDTPSGGYYSSGNFHGANPWSGGGHDAPYDRPFFLILNVAVGGHFFWESAHNSPYTQPWRDGQADMMMQFWNNRHLWQPTWSGEDAAMKIFSVKMEQY